MMLNDIIWANSLSRIELQHFTQEIHEVFVLCKAVGLTLRKIWIYLLKNPRLLINQSLDSILSFVFLEAKNSFSNKRFFWISGSNQDTLLWNPNWATCCNLKQSNSYRPNIICPRILSINFIKMRVVILSIHLEF